MKRAAVCTAISIAVFMLAGPFPALAQEGEGFEAGFSVYAVARVKVLDGSVWVRPSGGGDWEEYLSNSPIPPRSRVSVPEGSEAELQFHGGQFVLLTPGTDLEVRELQEGKSAFRLRSGEIRFDLPPDDFAPVSVRVPGGAVAQFPVPGRHWLTVTDRDETRLVVRSGRAVVTVDGDEHRLRSGDEAVIGRDITVGRYQGGAEESVEPPPAYAGEAPDAAPPVVVSELREYGDWVNVSAYGYVWRPHVAAGWSPYVYGRWVWISPYGWTWVSYEPWGWYPYRCGYWVTDPVFGWIWSPYHSFVSVNFVFGSNRYPHHRVYFRPATVRFVPEGR
ncbi:MAG: FecR family protein, partial [Deltaproteobacteria bacterium]|nr:FecR family protein [Deltaproteobacteria bacterium]